MFRNSKRLKEIQKEFREKAKVSERSCAMAISKGKIEDVIFNDPNRDIKERWDIEYMKVVIDVKGRKKIKRHDPCVSNNHYIEIEGTNHMLGWLYCGLSKFIGFEGENEWYIVSKKRLIKFINGLNLKKDTEDIPEKSDDVQLYTPYTRPGKGERIVMITIEDIKLIANGIYKKI